MSKIAKLLKGNNSVKISSDLLPAPLPPSVRLNQSANIGDQASNRAVLNNRSESVLPASVKLSKEFAKNTSKNNAPDVGNQFIEPYNKFEKTIQNVEAVNDFVTNMAFGANSLSYAAPNSKLAKSTNSFGKLGNRTNQVQAGLYAVDAARALVDPEYRSKVQEGINRMFDESQGDVDLMTTAFSYGSQRPLAFTAGLLRNVQNTRAEINRLEAEGKLLSQQIEKRKLDQNTGIASKGAKNIGGTGLDFKNFVTQKQDQDFILNQAKNYRSKIK